jgi:hypothetical protein
MSWFMIATKFTAFRHTERRWLTTNGLYSFHHHRQQPVARRHLQSPHHSIRLRMIPSTAAPHETTLAEPCRCSLIGVADGWRWDSLPRDDKPYRWIRHKAPYAVNPSRCTLNLKSQTKPTEAAFEHQHHFWSSLFNLRSKGDFTAKSRIAKFLIRRLSTSRWLCGQL